MFGINWQWMAMRALFGCLIAVVVVWGTTSCGDRPSLPPISGIETAPLTKPVAKIEEVSPPEVIQQLGQVLEQYQPQVSISSPQPDQILQDNTVTVKLQVQDLPIFVDSQLGMGPHLEIILDNQPYTMVYDLNQPLVLEDLSPGTHTIRIFASRPWHESFKNEGAYAQTTFHIFTKTQENNPDLALPLLTYNYPIGSYGAEPIMLDFYLTNAPLHLVAQENPDDDILDWRIRCTVNGESFILDQWQPIYLKGFKLGKNWVQLELLNELGNPVKNNFNNTVRLITYDPKGKDTFSQLVRGQLSIDQAMGIVDSNYIAPVPASTPVSAPASTTPPPTATPEEKLTIPEAVELAPEEPEPSTAVEEITVPEEEPTTTYPVEETRTTVEEIPEVQPVDSTEVQVEEPTTVTPIEETTPPIESVTEVEPVDTIEVQAEEPATLTTSEETTAPVNAITELIAPTSELTEKPGARQFLRGLFNRFQRSPANEITPSSNPLDSATPDEIEVPAP